MVRASLGSHVGKPSSAYRRFLPRFSDFRPPLMNDFVCVEVSWPSQPNGVMSSTVSLPSHTFTGQT